MRHTESTGISLDTAPDQIAALVQGFVGSSREGSRRGGQDEAALRGPVTHLCIGFERLKRKVIYVGQENSNHNWSIGGYWRGFSRGVSERRL
jgi:hypothetical protein